MKIAISGASGYIGQHLTLFFTEKGDEKEAHACLPDVRLVIARFGVVLSEDGGALKQMLHLQRLSRIGVVIGDDQQSFPWISVHDLCRSFDFMIQNSTLRGVVNFVSPQCITQKQLAYALARADGIRRVMPLPTFIFRLMFGEGASFVTEGQTVHPTKLLESGFTYDYPTIEKLMNITDHRTVQALDVRRYMGRWYEIARYESHFEKGMTDVKATIHCDRMEESVWKTRGLKMESIKKQ